MDTNKILKIVYDELSNHVDGDRYYSIDIELAKEDGEPYTFWKIYAYPKPDEERQTDFIFIAITGRGKTFEEALEDWKSKAK